MDKVLEWTFDYGNVFVNIRSVPSDPPDELLIASYILFLGRYFFICDDRQIDIVQKCIRDAITESIEEHKFAEKIYGTIFNTLNPVERDASYQLFLFHMPPHGYSEDKSFIAPTLQNLNHITQGNRLFAKYSLRILEQNGLLFSYFDMSEGPDVIFLPITVGIFYWYVVDKIRNKENKKRLDRIILDLLQEYTSTDPRSDKAILLPSIVIKRTIGIL